VEVRDLRYFVALAEELHFGRAARRVFIAQPPFSQQIRRFEDELGLPLFTRSSRHVELSDAGARLLPLARRTLKAADEFTDAARRSSRGSSGELRIAIDASVLLEGIPDAVRQFREAFPDVRVVMTAMTVAQQLIGLHNDHIDIAISWTTSGRPGIATLPLPPLDMVVALQAGHRFAVPTGEPLDLLDLRHEVFLATPAEVDGFLLRLCRDAGFVPHVESRTEDTFSAIALVGAGAGVVVGSAGIRQLHIAGVAHRQLALAAAPATHSMMWRPGHESPLLTRFVSAIHDSLSAQAGPAS
jgi:DNA-binding transcriptional LysR family regulator